MAVPERMVCSKCGKDKPEKEFYMKKDHTRCDMCKTCLTAFVDNKDPQTFLWILEMFDVPYIAETWIGLYNKIYTKNPGKFGPSSVMGQYLRSMNMSQYRDYTYADTDRLAFEAEKAVSEAAARKAAASLEVQDELLELQQKLDAGEITQAEFNTKNPLAIAAKDNEPEFVDFVPEVNVDEDDILDKLTPEDTQMLKLKWGSYYKPSQWVAMEDMYNKYANEYELSTDRETALRQVCKLNVKMDEALDVGDYNAYKALQGASDALRKSAKFTEAQNKEETERYLDSIGELVELCEREGGIIEQIPYPDDYPQDDVDFAIKDMKAYYYHLVTTELGLGDLIESYIKKLEETEKDDGINFDTDLITSAEEAADAYEISSNEEEQIAQEWSDYLETEIEDEISRILEDGEF